MIGVSDLIQHRLRLSRGGGVGAFSFVLVAMCSCGAHGAAHFRRAVRARRRLHADDRHCRLRNGQRRCVLYGEQPTRADEQVRDHRVARSDAVLECDARRGLDCRRIRRRLRAWHLLHELPNQLRSRRRGVGCFQSSAFASAAASAAASATQLVRVLAERRDADREHELALKSRSWIHRRVRDSRSERKRHGGDVRVECDRLSEPDSGRLATRRN